MELSEAMRRIFRQHWLLITIAVVLGLGAGAVRTLGGASYTATTRLVLDAPDPQTSAESMAIADTVRALATSPAQVRAALAGKLTSGRDPLEVAKHHISAVALGTSGVIQLSVSDRNPEVAAAIANGLAQQIVRTRLNVSTGRTQQIVAKLGAEIGRLDAKIVRADAASRSLLEQQRTALQIEQANILAAMATQPKPSIISPAAKPRSADSAPALPYLILGAILGLVIGVGAAAAVEIVRPTIVGGVALAREFGTQYIGTTADDDLPFRVGTVAATAALPIVGLVSIRPKVGDADLYYLADLLGNEAPTTAAKSAAGGASATKSIRGRGTTAARTQYVPFFEMIPGAATGETGLLLVAPKTLLKAEILEVNELLSLLRHPVLGLITHEPSRSRGERERESAPVAVTGPSAVPKGRVA